MDNKTFWKRFWDKYDYKISQKKDSIVFWKKWESAKHNTEVESIWSEDCDYETMQDFINDYACWLYDFWDLKPKFDIWDRIISTSRWDRTTTHVVAIVDCKNEIKYKCSWYEGTFYEKDMELA